VLEGGVRQVPEKMLQTVLWGSQQHACNRNRLIR
jgi:hypothetical protein